MGDEQKDHPFSESIVIELENTIPPMREPTRNTFESLIKLNSFCALEPKPWLASEPKSEK